MKRIIAIGLFLLCVALPNMARDLRSLFALMPDSVMPMLSKTNRLDCMDYLESGMKAMVENQFGELVTMTQMTDKYARIEMSQASVYELKLLVEGTDSVVCVAKTLYTPIAETILTFYNTKWQMDEVKDRMPQLSLKNFLKVPDGASEQDLKEETERMGTPMMAARLLPDSDAMEWSVRCDEGNPDLRKEFQPYLKETLKIVWQKGRFVLMP